MRVRPPTFDETPIVTATLDDLDLDTVDAHLAAARDSGRYKGDALDARTFLLEQRAAVTIESAVIPTVAGCMFFGRHPQHFFPYATIKLAHYRGDIINSEDVRHIDDYGGNVRAQIDRAVDYLDSHIERGYVLARGAQRREQPQYPPTAIRELTVNAVAHRDYTISASSIRIAMLRSRIEWVSPGSLPTGVTTANILDMQQARNPALTMLLYQSGYVEAYGQGIDTVFNVLAAQDLPLPEMREAGATFVIAVSGHQMLAGDDERLASLTDVELQIVTLIRDRRAVSAQDLFAALAPRSDRSVQYDLKRLVERGIIERAGRGRATTYSLAPR